MTQTIRCLKSAMTDPLEITFVASRNVFLIIIPKLDWRISENLEFWMKQYTALYT